MSGEIDGEGDSDRDDGGDSEQSETTDEHSLPFDGPVLLYTAATASVAPNRVPELLVEAQELLAPRIERYRRRYECVREERDRVVFLVPTGHWEELGGELAVNRREADALRRAHDRQLQRIGDDDDRREEFETALEIREAVVVGRS